MNYIKNYQKFKESLQIDLSFDDIDIKESLAIFNDNLLSSVGAEELNIFYELKLPRDKWSGKTDLELFDNSLDFLNSLASLGLRKGNLEYSDDYQTFLNNSSRFMFVYHKESGDLDEPVYLLFQSWNAGTNNWNDAKIYRLNAPVDEFYKKLSSKEIDLVLDEKTYTYETSNGSEWILKGVEETDVFKKNIRKEDLENILSNNKIKITIK